ncbi:hypothetical protein MRB53_040249 [Persea americana]|nr:hypothetical protein MRB53_040249 [Persea americana]
MARGRTFSVNIALHDAARRDAVDRDAPLAEVCRKALDHANDGHFARVVQRMVLDAHEPGGDAAHEHEPAAVLAVPQRRLPNEELRARVEVEHVVVLGLGDVLGLRPRLGAGVAHDNVDLAKGRLGGEEEPLNLGDFAHLTTTEAPRRPSSIAQPATDAATCAGDQGDFFVQGGRGDCDDWLRCEVSGQHRRRKGALCRSEVERSSSLRKLKPLSLTQVSAISKAVVSRETVRWTGFAQRNMQDNNRTCTTEKVEVFTLAKKQRQKFLYNALAHGVSCGASIECRCFGPGAVSTVHGTVQFTADSVFRACELAGVSHPGRERPDASSNVGLHSALRHIKARNWRVWRQVGVREGGADLLDVVR